jgi:hypothetical protein
MCSIEVPELAGLDGLDARELASVLVEMDRARRQIEAVIAGIVGGCGTQRCLHRRRPCLGAGVGEGNV